jgi:hypothetical protein
MSKKFCGDCEHGHFHPKGDMTKRICHGGPPQVLVLPQMGQPSMGADGKMRMGAPTISLQNIRPTVSVKEDACSLYKAREFGLAANNGGGEKETETKDAGV